MNEKLQLPVEVRASKITGRGVFAACPIAKGQTVIAWRPRRRVSPAERAALPPEEQHYISPGADGTFLLMGEPERYVNHSCSPNTAVEGESDVALRDIEAGEEITTDYGSGQSPGISFACLCGAANCRGLVKS